MQGVWPQKAVQSTSQVPQIMENNGTEQENRRENRTKTKNTTHRHHTHSNPPSTWNPILSVCMPHLFLSAHHSLVAAAACPGSPEAVLCIACNSLFPPHCPLPFSHFNGISCVHIMQRLPPPPLPMTTPLTMMGDWGMGGSLGHSTGFKHLKGAHNACASLRMLAAEPLMLFCLFLK